MSEAVEFFLSSSEVGVLNWFASGLIGGGVSYPLRAV